MERPRLKILLVEDNEDDYIITRDLLEDAEPEPFDVVWASNYDAGLRALQEEAPDACLVDYRLGSGTGLELLREARQLGIEAPIILLTGQGDHEVDMQAMQAGAADYLIMDQLHTALLERSIRYALERRRHVDALRAKEEEVRSTSQQLWQTAKLATMGELVASIAHELNNPMATVSLYVETLLMEIPEDDPKHNALTIIEQEVERMSNLVAHLLQFSRRSQQQVSTMRVQEEIESTLELVRHYMRNRNVRVECDFAPDVPAVQADRQQLRQLFLNLFTNATDAMPQGGTLTLRIRAAQGQVVTEVADTGTGIAPEDMARVMEPFFTTKPEGKGTGLGLAICRRIVNDHHGEFQIHSELGRGTAVIIRLPAVPENGLEHSAAADDAAYLLESEDLTSLFQNSKE